MGWLRFIALAGLAAAASGATRSSVLADLADRARAQPAEFAADALLRIAASPEPADVAWKRQLIEDAFHMAAGAQQPFARHHWTGTPGSPFDKAYAQGLDACTLQCRAVHAMLALDFKKARELFESMPAPQVPRLSCDDSLVYDVDIFYATAVEVAARAFGPKEIARDEPYHFLERYAAGMNSPAQAAPVARMLIAAGLRPQHFEALVDSFAAALKQLSGDERAFAATAASESDQAAVAALAADCARRRIDAAPLLDAWRAYLVRNLRGPRCADVRLAALPAGVKAITADELQSASLDGKALAEGQCVSPECRQLAAQSAALLVGRGAFALTAEQKSTGEWHTGFRQFLAALADWKGDDPVECFRYKSHYYNELFHTMPEGPEREQALSAFLAWLQQNNYQRDHRAEWFLPVNVLIIRAANDPQGMKTTLRALRESTDPVISLFAELEMIFPRPIESLIGLL